MSTARATSEQIPMGIIIGPPLTTKSHTDWIWELTTASPAAPPGPTVCPKISNPKAVDIEFTC